MTDQEISLKIIEIFEDEFTNEISAEDQKRISSILNTLLLTFNMAVFNV